MDDIEQTMQILVLGVVLEADVVVPQPAQGVVLFAHGSGSSRHSPRNVYVAEGLQAAGLAPVLPAVRQPTLLIVGERDPVVLDLNRRALGELSGEARLEVVPGATHLFEEPGALEQVARLARDWFVRHLRPVSPSG